MKWRRGMGRGGFLCSGPHVDLSNWIALSPTLSHSFVVGEGEESGAVRGCAKDARSIRDATTIGVGTSPPVSSGKYEPVRGRAQLAQRRREHGLQDHLRAPVRKAHHAAPGAEVAAVQFPRP